MTDFDKLIDRRNTNSVKWDVKDNELPMWVADMDFQTVPEVMEAMKSDVAQGIFGYQVIPDEYFEAVAYWYEKEHNFKPKKDWLTFSTGVVPTIGSILRHLTDVGDNVLIQEPNYNAFFKVITNNGHHIVNSELSFANDEYEIDWKDLEEKFKDSDTTSMILCNPHNPTGHIWSKPDLERIAQLTLENNVLLISDEIHGDLSMPGKEYIPFASLDESLTGNSISLVSPSKTFNLAVLHAATAITPNGNIKARLEKGLGVDGLASPGVLAINGSIAAYTKGHEWLHDLKQYVCDNRDLLDDYVEKNIPQLSVVHGEATYLAWIDCSKITKDSGELAQHIRDETGLYLAAGTAYQGNGNQFMRINLATQRSRVEDGLSRLKTGVEKYIER
ncbi:MalY/PatB family protein [Companilactobacillus mishanensis]|uniref:MalY/PatB family protein n=1 Tax=Companilactobacillus mishanensis TaxID=2486008 RepID=UPI000F796830|nr:MalY/PatB family protein [Companilactobacillus mishanensis]